MTEAELVAAYEAEITYQKRMLQNLGYWFSLCMMLAAVGIAAIYFYYNKNMIGFGVGVALIAIGAAGMLLFGYGSYKGRQNVNKVIDDLENKLAELRA